MERSKGKPSDVTEATPIRKSGELRDLSESHQMTLHRPLTVEGDRAADFSTNLIEFHLTIRTTNDQLSRKELSLLLEVLCYQGTNFGINLPMYLAISELYFRLLGNKRSAKEVKEPKIRLTLTVSEILLSCLRGADLPLDPNQYVHIVRDSVRKLLQKGLMSSRTYGSRYRTWRPERFFVVKIVPVDIQLLERRKGSEPYSGYCKGYGESHPSAHSKKTKPSPELDGDGSCFLTSEENFVFQRCTEPTHVLCEYLLIKYRNETEVEL
jgi:hypothetical protein